MFCTLISLIELYKCMYNTKKYVIWVKKKVKKTMFLKDGSFMVKLVYKYLFICVRQESNPDFYVHVIYN